VYALSLIIPHGSYIGKPLPIEFELGILPKNRKFSGAVTLTWGEGGFESLGGRKSITIFTYIFIYSPGIFRMARMTAKYLK
jgi:hypothetical protein